MLAYVAKSFYLLVSLRPNDAFRAADAGLAIDPNSAPLLATRSIAETYLRQFEQAKSDVQQAMRLSPRDPALSQWHNFLADAEIGLGNLNAAIEEANKAIDGGYRVFYAHLNLAAAHALKGDMDEATAALAEARRINPKLSIKWLTERKPVLQPAFDYCAKPVFQKNKRSSNAAIDGANHIISRQRPPDPLQLKLAHRLDLDGILDLCQHTRTNQDLPGLRFIA